MNAAMMALNRARGYTVHGSIKFPLDRNVISVAVERSLARGNYEKAEADVVPKLLQPGDTVLELGAGLGFISATVRKQTAAGKIVAYECNPDLIAYIKRVHRENGISNVEVRHGAVMANPTTDAVPFFIRRDMWNSSLTAEEGSYVRTVQVPVVSWDKVIAEVAPTAIIADIEGGELQLFPACDLSSVQRLLIELHAFNYGMTGITQVCAGILRQGFVERLDLSSRSNVAFERTK